MSHKTGDASMTDRAMPLQHHLILFIYATIMLLVFLDGGTALSRHEVYTAEPAREMLQGNVPWAVQTFAGEFRTNKPPTMSWLIAGCMAIFNSRQEWVCRLPSALAGILTAHAVGIIASRLIRHRYAGLLAGLITVTTGWMQIQSRLAEADMPLVACVTLAMLALVPRNGWRELTVEAQAIQGGDCIRSMSVLFWAATGFGFMLKLVAIFITIPAAIMLMIWSKDARVKKILRNPIGLGVFAIMLISWPVAAYLTYPQILHDWYGQTVGRVAGQVDQREAITGVQYIQEFFFHFWTIPWIVLPATPVIAIGLYTGLDRWKSPAGKFLISWVTPFLILITLTAYKSKHYSFPLLPALSVIAAYGTIIWMRASRRQRLVTPLLVIWFAGCAVAVLAIKVYVLPKADSGQSYVDLASAINATVPDDQPVRMIDLGEAPIAYYLDPIPQRIDEVKDVPADQPIYAVFRQVTLPALQASHSVTILNQAHPTRKRDDGDELLIFGKIN